MNRRDFISLLGKSAPMVFVPKIIKPNWKIIPAARPSLIGFYADLEEGRVVIGGKAYIGIIV
jgi:hypothetical protein